MLVCCIASAQSQTLCNKYLLNIWMNEWMNKGSPALRKNKEWIKCSTTTTTPAPNFPSFFFSNLTGLILQNFFSFACDIGNSAMSLLSALWNPASSQMLCFPFAVDPYCISAAGRGRTFQWEPISYVIRLSTSARHATPIPLRYPD